LFEAELTTGKGGHRGIYSSERRKKRIAETGSHRETTIVIIYLKILFHSLKTKLINMCLLLKINAWMNA
jgi:hypothetical protein